MGDTIYANVLMVGAAWQDGLVPVSLDAMLRAIELNGIEVEKNKRAFTWGRIAAQDIKSVTNLLDGELGNVVETLDAMIERRRAFLVDYQDEALAERYSSLVAKVRAAEAAVSEGNALTNATAQALFRLLSYKDEYEVARLHTNRAFHENLRNDFGDGAKLRFHLAPPLLSGKHDARGRPLKREFGAWVLPLFRVLAKMRRLRGTAFDFFGYTAERRMERQLIVEFEATIETVLAQLDTANVDEAAGIVAAFLDIRGFGPVKEESVAKTRGQVADLLDNFAKSASKAA